MGEIDDICVGGSPDTFGSEFIMEKFFRFAVPSLLTRINEPPLGMDCNVSSEEDLDKRTILFILNRDVTEGEELFMDYGLTYDRSGYSANPLNKNSK